MQISTESTHPKCQDLPENIALPLSPVNSPGRNVVPLPDEVVSDPRPEDRSVVHDKMAPSVDGAAGNIDGANDDMLGSIANFYRILELITEQGSGGLVDKIIIAQDSLSKFINDLSPNAYASLTKVDFKALDSVTVRPVGVYGPKDAIVPFLSHIGIVDEEKVRMLLSMEESSSRGRLQSGLYIARPQHMQGSTASEIFIVYWPEKETWDDNAPSPVRRNRVTFMRYLNKIADQILCLLSDEVSKSIVWDDCNDLQDPAADVEDDQIDRLFSFEVAKTLEQEENVTIRPGFNLSLRGDFLKSSPTSTEGSRTPLLLAGETAQGFLSSKFVPPSDTLSSINRQPFNLIRFQELLATGTIVLESSLSDDALEILIKDGLYKRFPAICTRWGNRKSEIDKELTASKKAHRTELQERLAGSTANLENILLTEFLTRVKKLYPHCAFESLTAKCEAAADDSSDDSDSFSRLVALYPQIKTEFDKAFQRLSLNKIVLNEYRKYKKQLVAVQICLEEHGDLGDDERKKLTENVFSDSDLNQIFPHESSIPIPMFGFLKNIWPSKPTGSGNLAHRIHAHFAHLPDPSFLASLSNTAPYGGFLAEEVISKTLHLASRYLEVIISKNLGLQVTTARRIQEDLCSRQIDQLIENQRRERYLELRSTLVQELQSESAATNEERVLYLGKLVESASRYFAAPGRNFSVTAKEKSRTQPLLEYTIHTLELTSDHRHNVQLDPKFVPTPQINERFSCSFRLPPDHHILHAQLLANEKILLIVEDRRDTISFFLDSLSNIGNAVKVNHPRKVVRQEKTGKDVVITFDESRRMLALCASNKFLLYIFVFDETFSSLQSWAHPINLAPWYDASQVICRSCFVTGQEELLLVDSRGQGRIFSLVTQQCRPASLDFQQPPEVILPSPDGACFLALFDDGNNMIIRAYHWTTFGSNDGILVDADIPSGDRLSLTSFVNRANVHLIILDSDLRRCRSVVFDITKKTTEFMFQEKLANNAGRQSDMATVHNCLVDCHLDVWTRFPVLPAVQRHTKISSPNRCQKRILFVTNDNHHLFPSLFAKMIKTFEQKTRKPTGTELRTILVQALTFVTLKEDFLLQIPQLVSQFRTGEWIVDLLCLIPIHIAVTRENRFIPLKDGVSSAEYEKSLLGAEVSNVVDSISFGWYESILQSYMATKPVKVVSSMGEQSVGKSYALNHLVDTSFAGSAMRTTEGVWMSVTPTDDMLVVALDFEGVHSIERSAQEDTLLVLFNTAISNLVLFRNNFALSRDITGLFQSFQSSSSVFDPAANPTLFQSTLVIIVKDSDKKEIVREFSLKFQKIVQEEQESNFISRLHAGAVKIIPWPVIESKQFYALFPAIKSLLDQQKVTHKTAGHFLHTLKTLMAKLKANDWRALSQSMAAHRAHQLLSMLPSALAFGYAELEPHPEPLKDLDTDAVINFADSSSRFFLSVNESQPGERDARLKTLCESWDGYQSRHEKDENTWINELSTYLTHLVDTRIEHVTIWISTNLDNFAVKNTTQASTVTALYRVLDTTVIDIKANVELCKQQCGSCQLLCLLSRGHDAKAHSCFTSHKCAHQCEFSDEHRQSFKLCGFPAGHSGKHVCVVEDHLCGEPCVQKGKVGCLDECTQVIGHEDHEHRCSADIHLCGKPCDLVVNSGSSMAGPRYRCPGTCARSSEFEHEDHLCDNRMCPIRCSLCNRLCASSDHLHSLDANAIHLCGETHSCQGLCSAQGICEIDTTPQSIEATFTGQHETFQYTKYSQVAKRLPCVIPIPAMQGSHSGEHRHSVDLKPFHFCETRCNYCGYYCTLPRGHSQQEHETSHGSMSKSRWAVESPDAVLELNGRKFGSEDDGAPMMCNLVCQGMGRHVHVDYCRSGSAANCNGQDVQHINARINPNPAEPRIGSHTTYSGNALVLKIHIHEMTRQLLRNGPEHSGTASNPAQPSYCTLPMFHAPHLTSQGVGLGYASNDGHLFSCKNPVVMQQAFHVMFVIDRSGSMGLQDRRPLPGTPVSARLTPRHNDRLGAVYSSLYGFWMSRLAAVNAGQNSQSPAARRDAYSVTLFDNAIVKCVNNDFTSSPDQLLTRLLGYESNGGTDYSLAIRSVGEVMRQHWSTERAPVVVFLSDGECSMADEDMRTLCRAAIALGAAQDGTNRPRT
ncbi:hypothetical protein BDZ97DRAFT_507114 [Flammula alnicola]|nr:hypothetical protein BDZ97DRAFT_507114 [Flammula alnicola]